MRCAIYTRKSTTEDGLEHEYNSLDAQRDACASYILSQRHEGWLLLPDLYDDGGFSGGNMERPSLKRLLVDVAAGRIDTIVIYKVDRLTRSLSDFAKIVEVLDEAEASFVSVIQSFNTTTSMGRLTLNMLLSFAQFEREMTGERISDKIAASKRKGLWMGGAVPLRALVDELAHDGHRTKVQIRASGPHRGGCAFERGPLYHLLSNRIYIGMIVHKGEAHPGEHLAIMPQSLWEEVQDNLAARGPGLILKRDTPHRAMISLLYDGLERPMTSSHTTKGPKARSTIAIVSRAIRRQTSLGGGLGLMISNRSSSETLAQKNGARRAEFMPSPNMTSGIRPFTVCANRSGRGAVPVVRFRSPLADLRGR